MSKIGRVLFIVFPFTVFLCMVIMRLGTVIQEEEHVVTITLPRQGHSQQDTSSALLEGPVMSATQRVTPSLLKVTNKRKPDGNGGGRRQPAVSSSSLPTWVPRTCMPGTELTDGKLLAKCKKKQIASIYCDGIMMMKKGSSKNDASHDGGVPSSKRNIAAVDEAPRCGQYAEGDFTPLIFIPNLQQPPSPLAHNMDDLRIQRQEECSVAHFNQVLRNPSDLKFVLSAEGKLLKQKSASSSSYFDEERYLELNTTRCQNFHYFSASQAVAILRAVSGQDQCGEEIGFEEYQHQFREKQEQMQQRKMNELAKSDPELEQQLQEEAGEHRQEGVRDTRGRGILFTGDSMVRQIFLRLINFIRGESQMSEHYFHQDGLYILRRGRDDLVPLASDGVKQKYKEVLNYYFPNYLSNTKNNKNSNKGGTASSSSGGGAIGSLFDVNKDPAAEEILLVLMFQWDIKPSSRRTEFKSISPIVHIAAFMYWWGNKESIEQVEPYISEVNQHFETVARRINQTAKSLSQHHALKKKGHSGGSGRKSLLPGSKYVYISTPWTATGTFGGVEDKNRLPRNARIAKWILPSSTSNDVAATKEKESWTGPHSEVKKLFLDYSGLAEIHRFPKTLDGIHYMCIWTPKFPQRVNNQKENQLQCYDPMNLAVVQWLLHLLHAVG